LPRRRADNARVARIPRDAANERGGVDRATFTVILPRVGPDQVDGRLELRRLCNLPVIDRRQACVQVHRLANPGVVVGAQLGRNWIAEPQRQRVSTHVEELKLQPLHRRYWLARALEPLSVQRLDRLLRSEREGDGMLKDEAAMPIALLVKHEGVPPH